MLINKEKLDYIPIKPNRKNKAKKHISNQAIHYSLFSYLVLATKTHYKNNFLHTKDTNSA